MKRKNTTRNALLTSVLSLLLCVSMLVGTTFAWFADTVVSGTNVIAAGNLDVELYHGKTAEPTEEVDNTDKLFTDFENKLIEWWEPGVVAYTNLKVANVGTLALKYQLALNFSNATAVEHEGKTYTLADVLKVAVVKGGFTGDRVAAHALDYDYTLSSFELKGELKGDETTETYGIVVYWEPGNDDYDNIFNLNNGKTNTEGGKTLSIELGVNLFASQLEYEEDSFDINYDKDAAIFVSTTTELQAAINNVQNNGTICLNDGTYDISGQLTVPGKSVNFVGVGENVVINMTDKRTNYNKFFYIYGSATEGEDVTVNISNVTLTAAVPCKSDIWIRTDAQNGAKVKGNVTVNLDNVNCTSVICDNNYVDGDTVNLNITNSKVGKVTLDASPFNNNGLNTYTNLTYKDSRIDHINIQSGVNDLTHITINGANPDASGEQQPLTYVETAEELQTALDNAADGEHIVFYADITGNVIATQKEGINITVDGDGHKYNGSVEIYGSARSTGAETLTFKNINFVADKTLDFIHCNSTESAKRYAHNVTVQDCTFTGAEGIEAVGMRYRQCYNMTVKNCTATNMHSLMWATGGDGITVDGVTLTNCLNGVSFGTNNNVVVKNSNIEAVKAYGYGVRVDATGAFKLTVEGSTIEADAPILLRKAKGAYTAIINDTTLTSVNDNTVVVTAADYEEGKELTAATGDITLIIDGIKQIDSPMVDVQPAPYEGDMYDEGANITSYKDLNLLGDAYISIDNNASVAIENVTADVNGSVIIMDEYQPAIYIKGCEFNITEGNYLIDASAVEGGVYQIFLVDVKVNGEYLTNDTAAQYLNNVNWYQALQSN